MLPMSPPQPSPPDPGISNPFTSLRARANSEYYRVEDHRLVLAADPAKPPTPFAEEAHAALREFILAAGYSCVDAKAAINRQVYRLAVYDELGSPDATAGLSRDLATFVAEQDSINSDHTTFIAVFARPRELSEQAFEHRFWQQLRRLNREDANAGFAWDPSVSADPQSPHFSFSFAGNAFFIIGLHANASRLARRFAFPALVFNSHAQFERLRQAGLWERNKTTIRDREMKTQGSLNPMIDDYGASTEARQYAGNAVPPDWVPPLTPVQADAPPAADHAKGGCPWKG